MTPWLGLSRGVFALGLQKGNVRHLCHTNPVLLSSVEEAWADVSDPQELLGQAGSSALCCGWEISPSRLPFLGLCTFVSISTGCCGRFLGGGLMVVSQERQTGAGVPSAGCWPQGNHQIPLVQSVHAAQSLSTSVGCGLGAGSEPGPCKTVLNGWQRQGNISNVLESCLWANEALTGLVICFKYNKI